MIIIGIGTAVFSTSPHNIDYSLGSLQLGPIILPTTRLLAALAAILFTAVLYLFLFFTRPGKAIRAVANNRTAAELMGIPSAQVLALSFGIGTSLACVAGGLIATFFPFTILSGGPYELKSFVICVLGGLGNPLGALLGGLLLGGLEGLIPTFMPVSWVPVVSSGSLSWCCWLSPVDCWEVKHEGLAPTRLLAPVLLIIAWGIYIILARQDSAREHAFTLLMFVGLASSLNILLGYTGYVSFGHIVFFGLGGYHRLLFPQYP